MLDLVHFENGVWIALILLVLIILGILVFLGAAMKKADTIVLGSKSDGRASGLIIESSKDKDR